jgi:hypothetical protein
LLPSFCGKEKASIFTEAFSGLGKGKILIPLQFRIYSGLGFFYGYSYGFSFFAYMVKRIKIHIWHELGFNVVHGVVEGFHEFVEIFLVEENLVLFVGKTFIIFVEPLFAFGDGKVIIVGSGRLHIEKISALPSLYFLRINLLAAVVLVLFHRISGLG